MTSTNCYNTYLILDIKDTTDKTKDHRQILYHENFDMDNLITPVDAAAFQQLLEESDYNKRKMKFVVNGFKNGFS